MSFFDSREQKTSTKILLILTLFIVVLATGIIMILPETSGVLAEFNQGVGFKSSAIYAFFITILLLVILAVTGGDGIIGELQFLLISFFIFFIIIWLLIAWIF